MNDAISRSAVLKILENDLLLHESEVEIVEEICTRVRALPALEVSPVVRCKDCRNSRMLSIKEMSIFEPYCLVCLYPHGAGVSYPEYGMEERIVTQNDYCSYGKQRENGW